MAIHILTLLWLAPRQNALDTGFMGGARIVLVTLGLVAGCAPQTQPYAQQQYPQQQPYGQQQPYPQQQQPYPQQQPQPYPQQQPAPQAGVTEPAAPSGNVPLPQPVAPPPQPYPPPQPQYPPPYAPQPQFQTFVPGNPQPYSSNQPTKSHFYDGEVIADFATVGVLASINLLVRQDIENGNAASLVIGAGVVGGGGLGYLLSQKFTIDASTAHATTMGMLLGIANGALLIQPTDYHDASSILGLLTLGSAVGTAGGFIYGHNAELTSGQSLFIGNMMVLGAGTAALTAIAGNRDGNYGNFENTTLALGLDGGTLIGAIVAPHLDWSPRRSKIVFASTFIGAAGGLLVAGTLAKPRHGDNTDPDADIVTWATTAGLWGGFAAGILLTRDSAPDPGYVTSAKGTPASGMTAFAPWVGNGQFGVMSGGTF